MPNETILYGICDFDVLKDKLIDCRAISRVPKNAQSVITILFPYYLGKDAYENCCVSKYAVPKDYHIIVGFYLNRFTETLKEKYAGYEFEWFVDNSPVPEAYAAAVSSLGVIGENSLLINEVYGSYVFIGSIVSTYRFPNTHTEIKKCLGCNKCKKACPNGAITEKGIDIDKCLSNISQKKGEIDSESIEKIVRSGCIWGCDICQDVCPMNKNAHITYIPEFKENLVFYPGIPPCIIDRAYAFRGKNTIERNLKWLQKKL